MGIAVMKDNVLKAQAFKLKGRLYTLTVLKLFEIDDVLIKQQLEDVVAQAPRLFERTPVVIDCSSLTDEQLSSKRFNLEKICHCMIKAGLLPIAIQGGNDILDYIAQKQGLAVLHGSASNDKQLTQEAPAVMTNLIDKLVSSHVRSGQQVVSKGGNLVITASVSQGAELLADGSIHVYGTLRGRALAGIAGDKQARIYCQALEAELVSIAGFYRLSDAIEPINAPCQIFIHDDHIQIERL
jgi:septum site-determining protein MinC